MSLVRTGFVPVPPGAQPGFDHADIYRGGHRMYVAHTGADRVDVLDCDNRTFQRSLPELPGVAGVLIHEEDDLLFTSDRSAARVSVFRPSTERLLGRATVGPHPNGLAYDARRRRLYVFNLGEPLGEYCTASVVELDGLAVVSELALPGRPRWAVYDSQRDAVYVNICDPAQICVIDCDQTAIAGALQVPSGGPHGLWLDDGRLFCATDDGALLALDRDSGQVLTTLPLPGAPDVLMHDPHLHRLYVAIGDPGVICSIDTERLQPLEIIRTEPGAHTCGWDPDRRCLYVFCPETGGALLLNEHG
jgi:serine/threonine-protein kinase